jgi:hypothetical protein
LMNIDTPWLRAHVIVVGRRQQPVNPTPWPRTSRVHITCTV